MSRDETLQDPSRRRFLLASAGAGSALVVGTQVAGCAGMRGAADTRTGWAPDACLRISRDGIQVLIPHAEMGQGIMTSLAMLVAEELEVDMDQLSVELAPAAREFDHPEWSVQMTGGSSSIRSRYLPLRRAGAIAREALRLAGAERLGVTSDECRMERGRVHHDRSGRSLSYLELAEDAGARELPDDAPLKSPEDFRLLGRRIERVDIPAKVDGSARFGIDTRPANAKVACVARPPSFGGSARSHDASAALAIAGVERVVPIASGIAVVADSYWTAMQGRRALRIDWDPGPNASVDSATIRERYAALVAQPADPVRDDGDCDRALAASERVLEASYELPYLAHAPMEPMNACADVTADRCMVWAPTQSPGAARDVAVALTGLEYDRVQVQPTQMGGGFGRRSEVDFVAEAVQISQAIQQPVQVIWSREDDLQHGFYRPSTRHLLRAALNPEGEPLGWLHRIAGPSVMERVMPILAPAVLPNGVPRWLKNVASGAASFIARRGGEGPITEGAAELPYDIANVRVEYAKDESSFVPVGFWRSVGHSHNAFVVEGFVDELAHAAGEDPYTFRRRLLSASPRHLAVLDRVAERSRWRADAPAGVHRGIAVHESFGSVVAMVAEVRIRDRAGIGVDRVFVAVDCGRVLNPDTVEAQIEGALAFGLSSALEDGRIEIRDGGVVQTNFDGYPLLRIPSMPEVVIDLLDLDAPPSGVGEIATPPIAPAVANAVFAATGVRLRSLPLKLES